MELDSQVKSVILEPGQRLFETSLHAGRLYSHARSRDPRFYANGPAVVTTSPAEAATWISELKAIAAPAAAQNIAAQIAPGEAPASPPADLLTALDNAQRILIVGGSGTGKTTLLCHLIDRRAAAAEVLLLDPHATPLKWPPGAEIVGQGREYGKIEAALQWLNEQLTARYSDLARGIKGERDHPQIIAASDEFTTLNEHFEVGPLLAPLLTEGRKIALDLIIASHSDRAGVLGLKGRYDLIESFDCVVYLANRDGQRAAAVKWGKDSDRIAYTLPGPYHAPTRPAVTAEAQNGDDPGGDDLTTLAEALSTAAAEAEPDPTAIFTPGQRAAIAEAYASDPTLSRARLCKLGVGYKHGRFYPAIDAIIAEVETAAPAEV